jgi:hypothetical protein
MPPEWAVFSFRRARQAAHLEKIKRKQNLMGKNMHL